MLYINNKKYKAFTLVELIIVIISILAGLTAPKFLGVKRDADVSSLYRDVDVHEKAVTL